MRSVAERCEVAQLCGEIRHSGIDASHAPVRRNRQKLRRTLCCCTDFWSTLDSQAINPPVPIDRSLSSITLGPLTIGTAIG